MLQQHARQRQWARHPARPEHLACRPCPSPLRTPPCLQQRPQQSLPRKPPGSGTPACRRCRGLLPLSLMPESPPGFLPQSNWPISCPHRQPQQPGYSSGRPACIRTKYRPRPWNRLPVTPLRRHNPHPWQLPRRSLRQRPPPCQLTQALLPAMPRPLPAQSVCLLLPPPRHAACLKRVRHRTACHNCRPGHGFCSVCCCCPAQEVPACCGGWLRTKRHRFRCGQRGRWRRHQHQPPNRIRLPTCWITVRPCPCRHSLPPPFPQPPHRPPMSNRTRRNRLILRTRHRPACCTTGWQQMVPA